MTLPIAPFIFVITIIRPVYVRPLAQRFWVYINSWQKHPFCPLKTHYRPNLGGKTDSIPCEIKYFTRPDPIKWIQPWTDSGKLHVVTTNEGVSGTVRMLGHKLGAIDESLRICQETRPLTHGAPPPVDKLLPGYLFFFFSCLASFFSLAVFCGFFFLAFFISSDLDMWLPSLVQPKDSTIISSLATKYK